jgi:hypothetical protein
MGCGKVLPYSEPAAPPSVEEGLEDEVNQGAILGAVITATGIFLWAD